MPLVNLPEITQGDTFGMAIWLFDESNDLILPPDDPERGYVIDSNVTIEAIVKDSQGRLLANLTVEPYPNQATPPNKGWVWLSTAANTKNWPGGWVASHPGKLTRCLAWLLLKLMMTWCSARWRL